MAQRYFMRPKSKPKQQGEFQIHKRYITTQRPVNAGKKTESTIKPPNMRRIESRNAPTNDITKEIENLSKADFDSPKDDVRQYVLGNGGIGNTGDLMKVTHKSLSTAMRPNKNSASPIKNHHN